MTPDELFLEFAKKADVDIEKCDRSVLISLAKTAFALATQDLLNPLRVAIIHATTVTTWLMALKASCDAQDIDSADVFYEEVNEAITAAMRQQSHLDQLLAKSLATMGES